jgi:hypothetical protein
MELILLSVIGAILLLTAELSELTRINGIARHTAVSDKAVDLVKRYAQTLTVPVTVRL